ncbi:glycosyltransferase family 4 protein [Thermococcus piezophilus]|uniref:Glycosyl transferase n=1 Tax=Thermococcus piezophilus TaxID=1712654 RepID=A0A172WH29_9EURY|nr:glycosyltransferase family 4 protein [Thermococcus piezophilus]ANF22625.1 hypothetical protein A7C91_05160 [Thermococcus piezophilus]
MKVVMLAKWSEKELSGGVAVHTINLVRSLSKFDELELYVISFGNESKTLKIGNAKVILIKAPKLYYIFPILALIRLAWEVKKIKPDIIHVQGSNLSPYLLYAVFLNRKAKKVITFHSYPTIELVAHKKLKEGSFRYRILKWLEKMTVEKADVLISVDTRIKSWIVKEFGIKHANKTIVIPNGINTRKFNPLSYNNRKRLIREKYNISQKDTIIFHAKAFTPKNGQEYLIRAMKLILKENPKTKLILAGDGPLRKKLETLTHELNITENVIFVGNLPNDLIPEYLAAVDIVVVPSIHIKGLEEATSIFLAEAMVMGKPVVASNIGGLRETIVDGVNGILVPDKDPNAISKAVLKIIDNPVLKVKLGRNAIRYIENKRTWETLAKRTIKIYRTLLKAS